MIDSRKNLLTLLCVKLSIKERHCGRQQRTLLVQVDAIFNYLLKSRPSVFRDVYFSCVQQKYFNLESLSKNLQTTLGHVSVSPCPGSTFIKMKQKNHTHRK